MKFFHSKVRILIMLPLTFSIVLYCGASDNAPVIAGETTNVAPIATSVSINGISQVGQTLTGNYTYSDADNDAKATSTYRWLSATSSGGTFTAISGATTNTYVIQGADIGSYLNFEVTPIAATGTTTGIATISIEAGPVAYANTITIDGDPSDWDNAKESFYTTAGSTAGNPTVKIAWDATYVYVGVQNNTHLAASLASKWVLIYIGGVGGSTTGQQYTTQTPTLPFITKYHIRWQANNSYTNAMVYGANWANASWDFTGDISASYTNKFVELRIPRADIGNPANLQIFVTMLDEGSGESTFAGSPSTSYTENAYDPNYVNYFEFSLTSGISPQDQPGTIKP